MKNIKFSYPNIFKSDLSLVSKIIKMDGTHETNLFEQELKNLQNRNIITVSNCTAGLHLSCIASDFKKMMRL